MIQDLYRSSYLYNFVNTYGWTNQIPVYPFLMLTNSPWTAAMLYVEISSRRSFHHLIGRYLSRFILLIVLQDWHASSYEQTTYLFIIFAVCNAKGGWGGRYLDQCK